MASFVDSLKSLIKDAMKARQETAKNIYRVVLGEIDTICARQGCVTDEQCHGIVRKIAEKNKECLDTLPADDARRSKLEEENVLLSALLPQTLSVEQIKVALAGVVDELRAAKSDGQATGLAMKTLKAANASVIGGDVSEAVKELRAGS